MYKQCVWEELAHVSGGGGGGGGEAEAKRYRGRLMRPGGTSDRKSQMYNRRKIRGEPFCRHGELKLSVSLPTVTRFSEGVHPFSNVWSSEINPCMCSDQSGADKSWWKRHKSCSWRTCITRTLIHDDFPVDDSAQERYSCSTEHKVLLMQPPTECD